MSAMNGILLCPNAGTRASKKPLGWLFSLLFCSLIFTASSCALCRSSSSATRSVRDLPCVAAPGVQIVPHTCFLSEQVMAIFVAWHTNTTHHTLARAHTRTHTHTDLQRMGSLHYFLNPTVQQYCLYILNHCLTKWGGHQIGLCELSINTLRMKVLFAQRGRGKSACFLMQERNFCKRPK